MRKTATVRDKHSEVKRVMVCEAEGGAYLFTYCALDDGPATGDQWFGSVGEADKFCMSAYGIGPEHWERIDDVLEGCQQDWIAVIRVKGRDVGRPEWGRYEYLDNGEWKDIYK
jgi:hypothetical protein